MTTQQTEAWKRVRSAGTVNLVVGIITLIMALIFILISIVLIVANFNIPSDDGGEPMPSWVLGGILLFFLLVFSLPIAIVDIVAGVKMRKPVPKPRGWVIYTVVVGALGAGSITGILQLIFGILALSSSHDLESSQVPAESSK